MSSAEFEHASPATTDKSLTALNLADCDFALAAGDARDIIDLCNWCQSLPSDTYGNVFIEVLSPVQIRDLDLPSNINVTWLCRERASEDFLPDISTPRGLALATAVDAWMSEWWRVDQGAGRHLSVWAGAHTSSIMQDYWQRIEAEASEEEYQVTDAPTAQVEKRA